MATDDHLTYRLFLASVSIIIQIDAINTIHVLMVDVLAHA